MIGCTQSYVRNVLSVQGMTCENYVRVTPEKKEQAIKMLANGATDYDVSIALGIKLQSISKWRRDICGIVYERGRGVKSTVKQ